MKRFPALALSLLLVRSAAVAADLGESAPLAAGPVETAALPVLPAAALPEQALNAPVPSVEIPNLTAASGGSPSQAATAQKALTQTAARLDGKHDDRALTAAFDGGSLKSGAAVAAGGLALSATPAAPVVALTPALPAAYEAWRLARTPKELRWKSPDAAPGLSGKAGEAAQLLPAGLVSGFLLVMAHGFLNGGPAFGVAAGLVALLAALGGADALARHRGTLVQLWQASHDQKYRVDPGTGQLKDIRGHRYGQNSDRYDQLFPGRLSAAETAVVRLLGVGAVLLIAHALGATAPALLLANLVATAGFALRDRLHKPAAPDR